MRIPLDAIGAILNSDKAGHRVMVCGLCALSLTGELFGRGAVSLFGNSLGTRRPWPCTFETRFRRPTLLRFAFESPHPSRRRQHMVSRCVVGHDGTRPFFWASHYSSPAQLDHPESLDLALAGATGISSGTAHTIGALLLPDITGFNLLDLRRQRFRKGRIVQGVHCTCVSGLYPRGGRCTAWFGTEDLLLRRRYRSRFNMEEVRFDPQANPVLALELFASSP